MIQVKTDLPRDEAPNGFYRIPDAEYFAAPGISTSDISLFLRSPKHYEAFKLKDVPREETQSMVFGSAFHTFILEPQFFEARFYIMRDDIKRNTREGKFRYNTALTDARGRKIIKASELMMIKEMAANIMSYRDDDGRMVGRHLLSQEGSIPELAMFWQDPITGRTMRGKTDMMRPTSGCIVDVKTTQDASPKEFAKSIAKYGYHRQAAMYLWGARELTGKPFDTFYFIAVESAPPHVVSIYRASTSMLDQGMREIRKALDRLDGAMVKNVFSGYQTGVAEIDLPAWARDGEAEEF